MTSFKYTPEQKRIVNLARAKQQEWRDLRDNTQWQPQEEKNGVLVECAISKIGNNVFRATGEVDFPNWLCYQVIADVRYKQKFDKNTDTLRVVEKIAANTSLIYQRSKKLGKWPFEVSPREFVMCNYYDIAADGTIFITVFTDQKCSLKVPETDEAIRGTCQVGGWSLEPLPGNRTKMTLVVDLNPAGSLPIWLLKQGNTLQGGQIYKLKK